MGADICSYDQEAEEKVILGSELERAKNIDEDVEIDA
jgi:hypothetical protein